MHEKQGRPSEPNRIVRLMGLVVMALLAAGTITLGPPWFRALVPPSVRLELVVGLLRGVDAVHTALLLAVPPALLVFPVLLWAARRRSGLRRWLVRALASCLALAIATALAEGVAAARLAALRVAITRHETDAPGTPAEAVRPRPPEPTEFPDPPGDRVVDVVVMGESSARGVPYHEWLSVADIVAWKLGEALPDRSFPVTYLARPALRLDQVHQLLETLDRRPDLVILYAGHNEFSMRHAWTDGVPHYDDRTPSPRRASFIEVIRGRSPVCRLIDETIGQHQRAAQPPPSPARQLVDVPVYTPAEYAERLQDFRVRLEAITAYCERVGALVVLVIPPGNDADFDPNRSFLSASTTQSEREAFSREFEAARALEEADPSGAMAAYRRLLELQPGFAETHYRIARLEERAGHPAEANEHYSAARDRDGLPVRCVSEFQDVYREVAANHPRAILIDGPAVLRALSPRGVVGDNFFTDGIHPSLIGYTELAGAILEALHARHVFGWGIRARAGAWETAPIVTAAECARHFGMKASRWLKVCEYATNFYHHAATVRFDPEERKLKEARYEEAARRIQAGTAPEGAGMPGVGTRLMGPAGLALTRP